MQEKADQSYGIIPYAETVEGNIEYFLIKQKSRWRGDSYWGFPKGHPEANETPEQTALRELQEEVQLMLESCNNSVTFDVAYDFIHENVLIKKQVSYFLAAAASRAYTIDNREVVEAGWFSYAQALAQLTHKNSQRVLTSAHEYLSMVLHP